MDTPVTIKTLKNAVEESKDFMKDYLNVSHEVKSFVFDFIEDICIVLKGMERDEEEDEVTEWDYKDSLGDDPIGRQCECEDCKKDRQEDKCCNCEGCDCSECEEDEASHICKGEGCTYCSAEPNKPHVNFKEIFDDIPAFKNLQWGDKSDYNSYRYTETTTYKPSPPKTLIKYLRKENGQPYGCVVAVDFGSVALGRKFKLGWSKCRKGDKFNKEQAVSMAKDKAQYGWDGATPRDVCGELTLMHKRALRYFK